MLKLKVSCVFVTATQKLCKLHIYKGVKEGGKTADYVREKKGESKRYIITKMCTKKLLKNFQLWWFFLNYNHSPFSPIFFYFTFSKVTKVKFVSSKFAENIKSKINI